MVGWHHQLNRHEFEQAPGDGDGQRSLAGYRHWGRKESDTTERLTLLLTSSKDTLGEDNGTPLQYSCLENPVGRGAWWATVHGAIKSRTRLKQLSMHSKRVCMCRRVQLCDPVDCSLSGSSVHVIFQARILTQGLNPCFLHFLHWHVDSLPLCHLGSPRARGGRFYTWKRLKLQLG